MYLASGSGKIPLGVIWQGQQDEKDRQVIIKTISVHQEPSDCVKKRFSYSFVILNEVKDLHFKPFETLRFAQSDNYYTVYRPQCIEQEKYWNDGSYSLIATYSGGSWPSGITHGAKVNYVNDDHSARVYSSTEMISKWGPGPLVRHPFAYCPYVSTAANFYD